MTREEAIERLAESYYDIGALGARWENESDDARLPFREDARRIFDALGLTVAPPPSEEKDAEIARLRGENEKLRGVRVALADLQVSVEVRDQLAAIEREVREAHAEEIASLRAEVARLRQPPPSPSREEAVERLTNMLLHAFAHGARAFGHGQCPRQKAKRPDPPWRRAGSVYAWAVGRAST